VCAEKTFQGPILHITEQYLFAKARNIVVYTPRHCIGLTFLAFGLGWEHIHSTFLNLLDRVSHSKEYKVNQL
jgi:hypothetical protein